MQESAECHDFPPLPCPTQELQAAVINAAHKHNLLTFAHATNVRETLLVLHAGVDALAHQFFDKPHTPDVIEAYKARNSFLIPTIVAISSMMGLETSQNWSKNPQAAKLLTEPARASLCHCMHIARKECNVQYAFDCIKALKAEGIDIVW